MMGNHYRLGGKRKSCSGVMHMEGIEEGADVRNARFLIFRFRFRSDANVSNEKSEYRPENDFSFLFLSP